MMGKPLVVLGQIQGEILESQCKCSILTGLSDFWRDVYVSIFNINS